MILTKLDGDTRGGAALSVKAVTGVPIKYIGVGEQLDAVLAVLSAEEAARIVVAYEPVWAIGTGKSASSEQAQQVHAFLRARLAAKGAQVADVPLLYGGSVKAANAAELFAQPDVDGGLIGGACLVANDFLAICQAAH